MSFFSPFDFQITLKNRNSNELKRNYVVFLILFFDNFIMDFTEKKLKLYSSSEKQK